MTNVLCDALASLKAQEPRVMTPDEYSAWCGLPDNERLPVVVERRSSGAITWVWWPAVAPTHDMTEYRIWTAYPTDAQREATQWV